jgi:hypothetical protein
MTQVMVYMPGLLMYGTQLEAILPNYILVRPVFIAYLLTMHILTVKETGIFSYVAMIEIDETTKFQTIQIAKDT